MPKFFIWQDKWLVMRDIPGRTVQYSDLGELQQSVALLARFHKASCQTQVPFVGMGSLLPERLVTRYAQYKHLYKNLAYFPGLQPFLEEYEHLGKKSLHRINATALASLTRADIEQGAIAHRDLASHNILISNKGEPWLIDFELAASDIQLGDLWQLASRALVEWRWDPHIYDIILHTYHAIRPLNAEEKFVLQHLFLFPNDFYREALGLLKQRKGFVPHKVIPYLQRMIHDREHWFVFLSHVGVAHSIQ